MGKMGRMGIVLFLAILASSRVQAGKTFSLDMEARRKLEIGADEQVRFENYSRSILCGPEHPDRQNGPDTTYLRFRERVWAKLTLTPDVYLYGRLTHRWQYYFTRDGENNNDAPTWEFPDELVLDNLFVNIDEIAGTNWSLRLGRFDLVDGPKADPVFGNNMLFKDPTRGDAGRTSYIDGAMATWKGDRDTLRLVGLYGSQHDWIPPLNDEDRMLRRGDVWVGGGAWTHSFCKAFGTELYYFYFDINDNYTERENAALQVPGLRVFGELHPQVDYSIEYARQYGTYQAGVLNGTMKQARGSMIDARLNLKAPADTLWHPVLRLEYTMFSGDEKSTADDYEGWHPVLADGGALYREECFYLVTGMGRWTNLHLYRASLDLTVRSGDPAHGNTGKLQVAPGWTSIYADREELGKGGGSHVGEMPTLFVDYQVNSWWKASLQTAYLFTGDYYEPSRDGGWVRLEMTFTY